MTRNWTDEELEAIGGADELAVAPVRRDGTPRPSTSIWVVLTGDQLHVRSYRGEAAGWFRAAQRSHRGHIRAGGVDQDVTFERTGTAERDLVDAGYRDKYGRRGTSYVDAMTSDAAAGTTLRLVPTDSEEER
jgi:hypothetical protein